MMDKAALIKYTYDNYNIKLDDKDPIIMTIDANLMALDHYLSKLKIDESTGKTQKDLVIERYTSDLDFFVNSTNHSLTLYEKQYKKTKEILEQADLKIIEAEARGKNYLSVNMIAFVYISFGCILGVIMTLFITGIK